MNMSIQFPKLGIQWDYVPKSVMLGGFEITIYGILIAAGMLLGLCVILLTGKREKQNTNDLLGMLVTAVIFGIIGARFAYVLFSMPLYRYDPMDILNLRQGGTTFYGALLGGIFGGAAYCVVRDVSFGALADTAVFGLLTAQIIGRWGDFFSRGSFGEYTEWVTCMQLPLEAVRADEVSSSLRENLISVNGISYIQAHPVFFYESLWCLLLLLILLLKRRRRIFQGEIFLEYLVWYGFGRFFLDLIRTDRFLLPELNFPVSSVISALIFFICGIMLLIRRTIEMQRIRIQKRRKEEFQAAMDQAEAEVERIGLEAVMAELAEANRTEPDRAAEEEFSEEFGAETGPESGKTEKNAGTEDVEEPDAGLNETGTEAVSAGETGNVKDSAGEEGKSAEVAATDGKQPAPEEMSDIARDVENALADVLTDGGENETKNDVDTLPEIPKMPEIHDPDLETAENTDKLGQN